MNVQSAELDDEASRILEAVEWAARVFYVDGNWRPFPTEQPESRVTSPDVGITIQFNSLPGRPPHAEYRGPLGRWWVRVDAETGLPTGEPVRAGSTSRAS